jgi:hypothetical protein
MKSTVFRVVALCSRDIRRFEGIYRLHVQSRRVSQIINHRKQARSFAGFFFLLDLFFEPEDGFCCFSGKLDSANEAVLQSGRVQYS